MSNNSEVNGSFVIGSGSIEETEYYSYYTKRQKGFIRGKIEAENTYINEVGNLTNTGLVTKYKEENESRFGIFKKEWLIDGNTDYYTIEVPKNTIIRQFQLK